MKYGDTFTSLEQGPARSELARGCQLWLTSADCRVSPRPQAWADRSAAGLMAVQAGKGREEEDRLWKRVTLRWQPRALFCLLRVPA